MTIEIRTALDRRAAAMRSFNRFYTRRIGVVRDGLLDSPFSLAEVRVMYELAHRDGLTAKALGEMLSIDPGYLSRLLKKLGKQALVRRKASKDDARQRELSLTAAGRRAFAPLDSRAHDEVADMLRRLPSTAQVKVMNAMHDIEALLGAKPLTASTIVLRGPRAGDLGWVVQAHGAIYAEEYGYDNRFEALVATIVAEFVDRFDAKTDSCWIAELDGEPVGSVFVVRKSKSVAKLRLFLIDPAARGSGIGGRLIDECIRFSRQAGYKSLVLWTQADLLAARKLYQRAGFKRIGSEKHHSFGKALVAETWQLAL